MKFGKEFKAQMVPEWQEKYMDYDFLKSLLKEVQRFKLRNKPPPTPGGLKRKLTLYRAFSGLTPKSPSGSVDIESQAILVNAVDRHGSPSYQTTFLMSSDEGGEHELVFFRRLDDELNKVNKFYKNKVDDVMNEADLLNKQMDALIAFRIKVENPAGLSDTSSDITRTNRKIHVLDVIEEASSQHERSDDSSHGKAEEIQKPEKLKGSRPAPLEVLDHVKINNTLETPRSTIKGFLGANELKFTGANLRKVEEQLTRAFVEFHHKLRLLKSFGFLNTLAFSKIMKKYDKITSRNASKAYMKSVDNSYLGSSDEINNLVERVEATFIKHFSNSNRSKGMAILRPKAKRERHRTTFSMGFLSGCSVALLVTLVLIIRAQKIMNKPGREKYMETMFPLYSLFGFIVLHLLMFAVNIFYWRRYRVNYAFIFGFKQGKELGYQQVFLLCFGIAVLALIGILANLDMEMDKKTLDYQKFTELVPLNLLILLIVLLLLPFNVLYRSDRFFFLACIFHCIAAPLYKVTLPDFFIADQLTSQVQALRSLEFYACYYGWGDYAKRENTCESSHTFNTFYFIVAVLPYWARLLQCLRRLFEERDPMQGYNGVKYFLTIVAVCLRTAYSLKKLDSLNKLGTLGVIAFIFSVLAAVFSTYWDLVIDWGLLQRHSKNRWLRDKLLVPHKPVYFAAMGLNVLLRFAWLQTVSGFKIFNLHQNTTITLVACLEIIRRGIWNFFRLENEHLNNVGKYRAFKSVPLPFNYDEDDDKDE